MDRNGRKEAIIILTCW